MGSRRQGLRLATASKHRRLDDLIGRFDDLAGYQRYLAIMIRFRSAVEPLFPNNRNRDDDPPDPLNLHDLLEADCRDLRLSPPPPPTPASTPPSLALGRRDDERLGAQYVLEGAALGARLLLRQAAALGLDHRFAARHLAAQARSADRWTAFLARLERAEPFEMNAAISGADKIFDYAIEIAEAVHVE